jgi:signal peptidase II
MIEKILRKSFIISSLLVFSIFLLDRLSKIYVIYLDKKFLGSELFSSKFLNIRLIWNEGIAFGLLSFNETIFYNALTFLILIIILIIFFMLSKSNGIKKYSLMMILGGAIGNIYDRIFYKAVPDFIDFHIGNFHWFIFNVADIFITLGVIFMIIIEITGNNKNKKI